MIQSGPGAPDWTPYEEISRFMEIAVLVCEDGGFYRHRGLRLSGHRARHQGRHSCRPVRARREHDQHAAREEPVSRSRKNPRAKDSRGAPHALARAGALEEGAHGALSQRRRARSRYLRRGSGRGALLQYQPQGPHARPGALPRFDLARSDAPALHARWRRDGALVASISESSCASPTGWSASPRTSSRRGSPSRLGSARAARSRLQSPTPPLAKRSSRNRPEADTPGRVAVSRAELVSKRGRDIARRRRIPCKRSRSSGTRRDTRSSFPWCTTHRAGRSRTSGFEAVR